MDVLSGARKSHLAIELATQSDELYQNQSGKEPQNDPPDSFVLSARPCVCCCERELATAVFRLKPMNVLWATQISILFLRVLISSASVGQQQGNVVLFRCTSSICDHASLF